MSNVKDAVVKRIRALCEEKNIKPNELAKNDIIHIIGMQFLS